MKRPSLAVIVALIVGFVLVRSFSRPMLEPRAEPQARPSLVLAGPTEETGELRSVVRVIDGDTLVLDGGERVRLIGVDTPETVHPNKPVERFGREASAFTKRQAEGKKVHLEYDSGTGRKDRYGRTLAYIYLPGNTLLNLEIIRQGYGHAYTRFPFSKMEEFRAAEREAREEGRGLWAEAAAEAESDLKDRSMEPDPPSRGGCIPASQCCKVCRKGKACGNSCIRASYTCRKGQGCACDAVNLCR